MTAIDRTAYPRPGARLTRDELGSLYTLTEMDLTFIRLTARGEVGRLMLATLLKVRRTLVTFQRWTRFMPTPWRTWRSSWA
jgi:hypothetical protein